MKKWKVLKEEDVSPSKWYPVFKHKVELGNGKIVDDFYLSIAGDVVDMLPVLKTGEFVLVKQYKHASNDFVIELPGGYIQEGKTLQETALAELEEEVGIKTTLENMKFVCKTMNNPSKMRQYTHFYIARDLEFNSKQKFDENEDIEVMVIAPKKALEMVLDGSIYSASSAANILRSSYLFPELFK
jgi:ADP-ribose pyrophosphatase YjhB (NUDIX family)